MPVEMHLVKLILPDINITIADLKSKYSLPDGSIDEQYGLLRVNKVILAAKMTKRAFAILDKAGVDVKLQSNPSLAKFEPL